MSENKKTFKFYATLLGTKALIRGLKLVGKNATHVPGNKAVKICPDFLKQIDKPEYVIGITGTNGKTTVSNMVDDVLADTKLQFIDNRFGGNIESGVVSAFVKNSDMKGRMKKKYAVLELDERMTTRIFPHVKPRLLAVTNLFRDSYRRNAHSEYIFDILNSTIPAETKLILNGEDPLSSHLAENNKRVYFGIEDRSVYMDETENIIQDMTACPKCGTRLKYDYIRYNHIGRAKCPACDFSSPDHFDYAVEKIDTEKKRLYIRTPKGSFDIKLLGENITDVYNQITAVAILMEFKVSVKRITESFEKMEIAKSRFEETEVNGKRIIMNTAKGQNPVACSRVCDFIRKEEGNKAVVLVIDDYFDRKETSENIAWFFDTDFEFLNTPEVKQIVVGGRRHYDLKLRLLMAGIPEEKIACIEDDAKTAELVDLEAADKVYILYDVFTTDYFANPIKKRLIERATAGEFAVSDDYKKYIKTPGGSGKNAAVKNASVRGGASTDILSVNDKKNNAGSGKVIEVLYPEFCNLFGDSSNVKYLKQCLPGAEFRYTAFTDKPYFADHKPDLIYLGAMTERKQEMVAEKLLKYRDRLIALRDEGAAMLFTSNAIELLGKYIEKDDGSRIECLGLYDFSAKRNMMNRLNSLVRGFYGETELIGFKTQFSEATPLIPERLSFFKVDKGMGMNKESDLEGIHDKNLFATYMVGPFLVLNPDFTKDFLQNVMGVKEAAPAFDKLAHKAYKVRLKEFHDPKCAY